MSPLGWLLVVWLAACAAFVAYMIGYANGRRSQADHPRYVRRIDL